jgi:hypothetical protein
MRLEQARPFLVDENRVGGHAALDLAAGAALDIRQLVLKIAEAIFREEQRLPAVKDQQELVELVFADVLLEPGAELILGVERQHRRLVVDLRIAKPIAVSAIDVAARRELDQHEAECGRLGHARHGNLHVF